MKLALAALLGLLSVSVEATTLEGKSTEVQELRDTMATEMAEHFGHLSKEEFLQVAKHAKIFENSYIEAEAHSECEWK